jgi:hypothetical protein
LPPTPALRLALQVPGLLASVSLAGTETLGVELTRRYAPGNDAQQEVTSQHLSIMTCATAHLCPPRPTRQH